MADASPGASGWAGFVAFHLVSVLAMAFVIASAPDPSGQVALVYSPLASAAEAFQQAAATGGRIVRVGRKPWIVVVAPDADNADFATRARASGALLLLNPVVAGGCTPKRGAILVRS